MEFSIPTRANASATASALEKTAKFVSVLVFETGHLLWSVNRPEDTPRFANFSGASVPLRQW